MGRVTTVREVLLPGVLYDRQAFEHDCYPDPNSGCLLFAGVTDDKGYGRVVVWLDGRRKLFRAHRVAWAVAGREVPEEPFILRHLCHTRCCCNVDHLAVGTRLDNARDTAIAERFRHGKFPRGVWKKPGGGRYAARVQTRGSCGHIGMFDTIEEAAEAVRVARAKMFADRGIKLVYPAPQEVVHVASPEAARD